MPVRHAFRRMDAAERRHDGPIPPFDPASRPSGAARALFFQSLAADQRDDLSRRRCSLPAEGVVGDRILIRDQARLRFYRDQGVAWTG